MIHITVNNKTEHFQDEKEANSHIRDIKKNHPKETITVESKRASGFVIRYTMKPD